MSQRPSRTFIVAGVIIGLSLFVLLAMLFYGPSDYSERSEQIADEDGLRFHIASLFFGSFGIGAYVGWLIILTWAIIVFFRESVGELALRAVSLAVVVISGAALAELLGSGHLGGDLGYAIGSVLEASLGTALGVLLIGAVFGVSVVLATDYGFHSYYKEARSAIAVVDDDEPDVTDEPSDLVKRIDKIASEVDEEVDEVMPPVWPPVNQEDKDEPVMVDGKPPIEEEQFDDILAVAESKEEVDADGEASQEVAVLEEEMEADAELLIEAEPEAEDVPEFDLSMLDVVEETAPRDEQPTEAVETEARDETTEEPETAPAEMEVVIEVEEEEETTPEPVAVVEEAESLPEQEAETPTSRLASALDALLGPTEEAADDGAEPEVLAEAEPEILVEAEPEILVEAEPEILVEAEPEILVEAETEILVEAEPEVLVETETEILVEAEEESGEPELATEYTEEEPVAMQDPMMIEVPTVLIDDEIYVVDESLHEIAEETPERTEDPITEEMPAMEEAPVAEPEITEVELPDPVVFSGAREREVIDELIQEAEEEVVEELVEVSGPTGEQDDTLLPFMEGEEKKSGVFRSFFRRKKSKGSAAADPLLNEAANLAIDRGKASVVLLQRRLDIGHTRASRIIESLELEGLVGPLLESGSREVLMTRIEWETRS